MPSIGLTIVFVPVPKLASPWTARRAPTLVAVDGVGNLSPPLGVSTGRCGFSLLLGENRFERLMA